jgi:hypothetical protein
MSGGVDTADIKEVFAHFGRAMYQSQCLEISIVAAYLLLDLVPKKRAHIASQEEWQTLVNSTVSRQYEQTLGKMIRTLMETGYLPASLKEKLSIALAERNRLAHGYFRARQDEFLSTDGCRQMMVELSVSTMRICEAGESLERMLGPVKELFGLTDNGAVDAYQSIKCAIGHDL